MFPRSPLIALLAVLVLPLTAPAQAKRPLRHTDADSWRSIASPQLSRDGQFAAYALIPQEGDGEYVVRNLRSAQEWRLATGGSSGAASASAFSRRPSQLRGAPSGPTRLGFTADSRLALLSVTPTKKEIEQAKA